MTYAVVDTAARRMRYARAGHNPLIHMEARTGRTRVLAPAGLGLGLDPGDRFEKILEEDEVHRLIAHEDAAVRAHRHRDPLLGGDLRLVRHGERDVDATAHHGCRDHEYEEQDEHHVDERRDVDLAESSASSAAVVRERHGYSTNR